MLRRVLFLSLYFIAWVALFVLARLAFLFFNFNHAKALTFNDNAGSFLYGLRMDFSMASYLLLPLCLAVLGSVFIPFLRKSILYKIYTAVVLFLFLLIIIADLEMYRQWGFRIDATPLKYLSSPAEMWASVSHLPLFWYFLFFLFIYLILVLFFNVFLDRCVFLLSASSNKWLVAIAVICFIPLLIIPLRGGLQQSPLNQSNVYFSDHPFANHMAINANWNFLHGVMNNTANNKNPYNYLPYNEAKATVDSLYAALGSKERMIKEGAPNVLLIIWESFTAKALNYRLEGREVTPNFNRLKSEGVFFSNLWATGDRTDKGLAAILSGYPALPASSIIRTPNKAAKLPAITKIFREKGYTTPFYYGGEAAFANMKSYLTNAGCAPITDKKDFALKDQNSKWGAHDGVVAARLASEISTFGKPFFATWLTLSSHEPFEVPIPSEFKGQDDATKFLASIHYTDKVIGDFISGCKQQPWWNNTLVIVIADHGHIYPASSKEQNFSIPMLWLGGALNKTGIEITKICSQQDLAATIMAQVGFTPNPFYLSKNIFDSSTRQWAFFSFNNGFGLVQPEGSFVFDNVGKMQVSPGRVSKADVHRGKAVQQVFYQDFLEK